MILTAYEVDKHKISELVDENLPLIKSAIRRKAMNDPERAKEVIESIINDLD